ncbi:MAG: hypothetical protein ACRC92_21515 [Peptostreptococcaceae bacterium]
MLKNYKELLKDNQKDLFKELIQDNLRMEYINNVFITLDNDRNTYDILYKYDIANKKDLRHKATQIKSILLKEILITVMDWQGLTPYQTKKQLMETNIFILLNKELIEVYVASVKELKEDNTLTEKEQVVIEILKENMVYNYLVAQYKNVNDYKF